MIVKLATVSVLEPRFRPPPATVTEVEPRTFDAPRERTPALTVVAPVWVLVPESTQVPDPFLTSEVAPVPLSTSGAASVLLPVLVPVRVSVRAVLLPEVAMAAVLLRVSAPEPEASSVAPLVPTVKPRLLLTAVPVYCSVPPLMTRLAAAFADWPMPLAAPPLASKLVLRTPPLIVVAPVLVLVPESTQVPDPFLTSEVAPVPLSTSGAASVLLPVLVPVRVSVRAVLLPEVAMAAVLLRVSAPEPEASSVAPLVPTVKPRLLLTAVPVYCSVPPLMTRLAAAFVDWPMPLAAPPLASRPVLRMPPLTVVVPV